MWAGGPRGGGRAGAAMSGGDTLPPMLLMLGQNQT
jgi:hypothetical protein